MIMRQVGGREEAQRGYPRGVVRQGREKFSDSTGISSDDERSHRTGAAWGYPAMTKQVDRLGEEVQ